MLELISFFVSLFVSTADVERLRSTAPIYLTTESARHHAGAAIVAGALTRIDPTLLLSIAHHESRYSDERTREAGGLVSCGVMTPTPLSKCPRTISFVQGYLDGARHLRDWLDYARGDLTIALLGYGGGVRAIRNCGSIPDQRTCQFPRVIVARAKWIHWSASGFTGSSSLK